MLEKTLESPLNSKEIKPVNPKGNQSWIFIGRADAEIEAPILWPPDVMNWLIGKDPVLGKLEGKRRRGWQRMRWLYGISDLMNMSLNKLQEFGNGEGSLVCCSPWGHKESGLTEWLNWTDCTSDFLRKHLSTVFNLSLLWHIQIWCSCIQLKLQVNNWDFNDMKSLEYLFYFNIKQNE